MFSLPASMTCPGGQPMKAVRIHEFGGPDRVQIEEVATPKVTRGKALVRIRAAAVNPVDWMVREHLYNPKGADRVPMTLGQDFAGVIEKIGSDSQTSLREGDVVLDPLGGDTQARSWSVLKRGGMLINLIGEIDEEAAKRAGVRAVDFGMEYDVQDLEQIAALVESGAIRPHISKVLPLDQAKQAMDLNQQGKSHGKIVLEIT